MTFVNQDGILDESKNFMIKSMVILLLDTLEHGIQRYLKG